MIRPSLCTLLAPVLLSIPLSEVFALTAHLRYREAPLDPSRTMRAAVYRRHGAAADVLRVEQVARPAAARGMVVIKVAAAALNPVDFKMRRNEQPALLIPKPHIAGVDVAGTVVAVGAGVERFAVGDAVFGMLPIVGSRWGALAEYAACDASAFALAPKTVALEEAAGLPLVGLTVLQVADQAGYAPGAERAGGAALVQAASGGVGSFAVQYFRHVLRLGSVAAVCGGANAERVRALGATSTIDYTTTRFEEAARGVDLVLDPMAWDYMERTLQGGVLRPGGAYCHIMSSDWRQNGMESDPMTAIRGPVLKWASRARSLVVPGTRRVYSSAVVPDGRRLERIAGYVDAGLVRPVVDRIYDGLESAVEAFEHLETGHARGKVIVRVA